MVRPKDTQTKFGKTFDHKKIEAYENTRYKETMGQYYLPTGTYSLADDLITAYNDADYIHIIPRVFSSATYFGALVTAAYPMGMLTGNMKDVNANEAAAFETIAESWIRMLLNLGPQQIILDLMENPPRSDLITAIGDGESGNTNVALFEEDARNTLIGELEALKECMPNAVLKVWQVLNKYFKLKTEWVQGAANLPGMYLVPICPYEALTTLQTLKETIYSNSGLARNHMQKFGIKFGKFSRDQLHGEEHIINGDWDPEVLGFLANWIIPFEGDGAPADDIDLAPYKYAGIDGHENFRYVFKTGAKGGPNSVPLNIYLFLIHPYNVDFNKYGGLLKSLYSTTDEDITLKADLYEATEFLADGISSQSVQAIMSLFRCSWINNNGEDNFRLAFTGDYIDADNNCGVWPASICQDLKYWTGLDEAKLHGMNERLMSDLLYK